MKKIGVFVLAIMGFVASSPAHADLFGADVGVLAQILVNAVQQLIQLEKVVDSGSTSLSLLQDINKGINDSINDLIKTGAQIPDRGTFNDWRTTSDALRRLQEIYGKVPDSNESTSEKNTDQVASEAIALNNSIYDYARSIDDIGEDIKTYSHKVSPGGAAKLTAEGTGVMLHVMNEGLRAQATGLKLQAQSVANENRKEKIRTQKYLSDSDDLSRAMDSEDTSFTVPRL